MREHEIENLVEGFENRTLAPERWSHREHLIVATVLIARHGNAAVDMLRKGIYCLNEAMGVRNSSSAGYHETVTVFWAHLIRQHLDALPENLSLEEQVDSVLDRFSDKNLLQRYYSRERLMSTVARGRWVEPDLRRLP